MDHRVQRTSASEEVSIDSAPTISFEGPLDVVNRESSFEVPSGISSFVGPVEQTTSEDVKITNVIINVENNFKREQFNCSVCRKGFTTKKSMKEHERKVHSDQLLFACEFCTKKFVDNSSAVRHRKIHTRVGPHKCGLCAKSFMELSVLKSHQQNHFPNEKPFKCESCGRGFLHKSHIDRHVRIHTGEKPFHCDQCGCAFARTDKLSNHKLAKHSRFKCRACGETYPNPHKVKAHFKRVHFALDFNGDWVTVVG